MTLPVPPTLECARAMRDGGIDAMAALNAAVHEATTGLSEEDALRIRLVFGTVMGEVSDLITAATRAFPEMDTSNPTWFAVVRERAAMRSGPPVEHLFADVIPVLMARDVAAALVFYGTLGFQVEFQDQRIGPRYAGISRGNVRLHLQWQDASHWDNSLDRPMTRIMVRDLDVVHAEFAAQGITATPHDFEWGRRELHFYDIDGNGLQFFEG